MTNVLTTKEYQNLETKFSNKSNKQSFKEAGYSYVRMGLGGHILRNKATNKLELFFVNKNHASWGLTYKNTHLEFARTLLDW